MRKINLLFVSIFSTTHFEFTNSFLLHPPNLHSYRDKFISSCKFSLNDYMESSVIGCEKKLNVSYRSYDTTAFSLVSDCVLLVDLSVREFDDISPLFPWMANFISKLTNSHQDLLGDQFLFSHDIGHAAVTTVSVARIPQQMYKKLELVRKIIEAHRNRDLTVVMVSQYAEMVVDAAMVEAMIAGAQIGIFQMPSLKSRRQSKERGTRFLDGTLSFLLPPSSREDQEDQDQDPEQADAGLLPPLELDLPCVDAVWTDHLHWTNHGTNLARALTALPPNVLTPAAYSGLLRRLSTSYGWEMEEWCAEELRDLGCGAFFAVCQGNPKGFDRLVRLRCSTDVSALSSTPETIGSLFQSGVSGRGDRSRPVVLVGKGVCYDTGGVNLKSADNMKSMKTDMAGSSAALGVFMALTQSGNFTNPLECWLALAENNVNYNSYRPDDVVTAVTGDTIEMVHTDAEGRLLLADVLALASRKVYKKDIHGPKPIFGEVSAPRLVVDFATLTGATIKSLTTRYIGAFTNKNFLLSDIIKAGEISGERMWPFPLDDDYADDLQSDVADVLQCRVVSDADHIYAAMFLKRFVNPSVNWLHLDLGSAHRGNGLGHVPTEYTGSGVRAALQFIRNH